MELTKENNYTLKRAAAIAVLFVGAAASRIFWLTQVQAQWGSEPFYTWMSNSSAPLLQTTVLWLGHLLASLGLSNTPALELSTMVMYVLFGGLLVAPVYGIARRMSGETIAAGAGLATVFYPAMLESLPQAGALVEPVYLLLVAAAWYFLLVAVDEGVLWPAAAGGLFVGLAYLIRPEALIYLVFALGLLLVATWLSRKQSFEMRRAVANFCIATMMFALIAGPQLAALLQMTL